MTTSSLHLKYRLRRTAGFTLVELLTVIAVIAILAAILIPVAGGVRRSAAKSKTQSQFAQYATAYQAFRADNGFYPTMGAGGAEFALAGNNDVFIQTLSGRTLDGQTVTGGYARQANRRLARYYTFSPSEFDEAGRLVDGFGNPNLFVVIDREGRGAVAPGDFQQLSGDRRPAAALPGSVFFYADPQGNPDWEYVLSWE